MLLLQSLKNNINIIVIFVIIIQIKNIIMISIIYQKIIYTLAHLKRHKTPNKNDY